MAQNDTSRYIGVDRKQEASRDTKPQRKETISIFDKTKLFHPSP